jgi:hypothetical protein
LTSPVPNKLRIIINIGKTAPNPIQINGWPFSSVIAAVRLPKQTPMTPKIF